MSPSQFGALQRQSSVRVGVGQGRYLLRFESLFHAGRGLCFPCDERGEVTLDQLSEQARENYLFARAVVGHEYATPVVQRCDD
ncbi:hypothetical protein CS062_18485 [Roseateles chitinivorans]|jgi:hypothetical protein|uniref:Uncharacterized protein n=1 Tax=Roseateles chitinivorans TaxID=2917965 RepID=A0A2G9C5G2_9BURK|nr:hypothetical protein [Roseateles chitinivorans]PIM51681.1 hypothetical protein CS062_18485 [Roseateles chitinivorans]